MKVVVDLPVFNNSDESSRVNGYAIDMRKDYSDNNDEDDNETLKNELKSLQNSIADHFNPVTNVTNAEHDIYISPVAQTRECNAHIDSVLGK